MNFLGQIKIGYQLRVVLHLAFFLLLLYLLYRYLLSDHGAWLRKKIPFLLWLKERQEVRAWLRTGEYAKAGEFLIARGRPLEACRIFLEGKMFNRAADVYLAAGRWETAANLYERGQDFGRAGDIYLEKKQLQKAEESFRRAQQEEKLIEVYRRAGQWKQVGELLAARGETAKAAALLEEQGQIAEAARWMEAALAEEAAKPMNVDPLGENSACRRLARETGRLYEKNGQFEKAGEIYLKYGLAERAGAALNKAGQEDRAVELLLAEGKAAEAADLLRRLGQSKRAAAILAEAAFQSGNDQEAIDLYLAAEKWSQAAEIHAQLGAWTEAAKLYEKGGEANLAGSAYAKAGLASEAARCYARAGQVELAAKMLAEAGASGQAAELFRQAGKPLLAGRALYREGRMEEALQLLTSVPPQDPDYTSALHLIGRIQMERGDLSGAMRAFEHAAQEVKQLNPDNLDLFCNLALLAEQLQAPSTALRTVEEMLEHVDPAVLDREKLEALKKRLTRITESRVVQHLGSQPGFPSSPAAPAAAGENRYQTLEEIGRGGMGIVYRARDRRLERIVALKILPQTLQKNPQAVKTFNREARSAAALNHENIVTIYDTGVQEGSYYIAMELIEGRTIKDFLRQSHRLTVESALEVARQALCGLAYAHEKKIVHRDLTNSNIMWNKQRKVKIMDFGLARVIEHMASEQSIIGGTPSYMSPEQAQGSAIDHRTDVYSLGICLFEMLTGQLPFVKGNMTYHHLHTPPPSLGSLDPSLPKALDDVIQRCLQKDPHQRYQTAEEMSAALRPLFTPSR